MIVTLRQNPTSNQRFRSKKGHEGRSWSRPSSWRRDQWGTATWATAFASQARGSDGQPADDGNELLPNSWQMSDYIMFLIFLWGLIHILLQLPGLCRSIGDFIQWWRNCNMTVWRFFRSLYLWIRTYNKPTWDEIQKPFSAPVSFRPTLRERLTWVPPPSRPLETPVEQGCDGSGGTGMPGSSNNLPAGRTGSSHDPQSAEPAPVVPLVPPAPPAVGPRRSRVVLRLPGRQTVHFVGCRHIRGRQDTLMVGNLCRDCENNM